MENVWQRFENYEGKHCWQYEVRTRNLKQDLVDSGLSQSEIEVLKPKDFIIKHIPKDDKESVLEIKCFIEKHEWLGKLPNRPTHRFGAYYKGILAGVVIMATPNAFSHILGKEFKNKEKLISRGACISWSPKSLGSYLLQQCINWMVENSEFRIFSAYSDPEAKELGTIYQALNFIYLGQKSGSKKLYLDKDNPEKGWFSSRDFRKVSSYKKYAKELNINWDGAWNTKGKMNWELVPNNIEKSLRKSSKLAQSKCIERNVLPKHKYIKIQGQNKRETKYLLKQFRLENPKLNYVRKDGLLIGKKYPKERGI
jgi:hypothetical protein